MRTDLLLKNGKIWTGNPLQPEADAVAISGSSIVAVGSAGSMPPLASNARTIDLKGRRVVPGFNDAHVHFYMGGDSLSSVKLRGAAGEQEVAQRLARYAQTKKDGTWILNGNWNDQEWSVPELPTHHSIDAVTSRHPVFVHRSDGHMCLANSLAMRLAGVDRNTQDVSGGEIVRDSHGEPTGIFKDNAKSLIERVIPPPSREYIRECLLAAQDYAAENGVTSIHDMGVLEPVYDLLSSSLRKAKWTICRLVFSFRSQFFHSRRHFSNHAKDRSTIQRFGSTTNACNSLRLTT